MALIKIITVIVKIIVAVVPVMVVTLTRIVIQKPQLLLVLIIMTFHSLTSSLFADHRLNEDTSTLGNLLSLARLTLTCIHAGGLTYADEL